MGDYGQKRRNARWDRRQKSRHDDEAIDEIVEPDVQTISKLEVVRRQKLGRCCH